MHLKAKHLDAIQSKKIIDPLFIADLLGINKSGFFIKMYCLFRRRKIRNLSNELESYMGLSWDRIPEIEMSTIEVPDISICPIIVLKYLESIKGRTLGYQLIHTISAVTFKATTGINFDASSKEYKDHIKRVENMDLIEAIGVFKYITRKSKEFKKRFKREFSNVEVSDPDMGGAQGHLLSRFSIYKMVISYCADTNERVNDVWHESAIKIYSHSLYKATESYVHHRLTTIKTNKNKNRKRR